MIQYIVECIAFQLIFLVIYDLFLKRETFFQWNRLYLIATYVLSLLLPWVKIEALKTSVPETFQDYPEFLWNLNDTSITATAVAETDFSIAWEYTILFGGMVVATLLFGYKLYQIYALKRKGEVKYFKDFTRIIVANSSLAFSFFKSIFLGDKILKREHQSIVQHELVHIRQRHSYDLMFFEIMRIVGWFNPLVYLYHSRISELHEFIADAHLAKTHKKAQYQLLLSEVFQTESISFINQFFKKSLIKKRIVMLQKTRSKRIFRLKYLLLVPFVTAMLFYSSCESDIGEPKKDDLNIDNKNIIEQIRSLQNYNDKELTIRKIKKDDRNLGPGDFISVVDVGSLNENEISQIQRKIANVDFSNRFLYISDDKNAFLITTTAKESTNDVPFAVVEEAPIFPGCEDETNKRACFNKMIQRHISKNFRYPQKAQELGIQGRVSTMFTIAEDGSIQNIRMRGPDSLLENEVERIIQRLPKMQPGIHNGETVSVPFSIPVTFKLEQSNFNSFYDKKAVEESESVTNDLFKGVYADVIPFSKVNEAPIFPDCEFDSDKKSCFQKAMIRHIKKHFNYPKEAQQKGIQGRVAVLFIISTDGTIKGLKTRGPDKLLEAEAKRIISRLPEMLPAKHGGRVSEVAFSIPITFKLK